MGRNNIYKLIIKVTDLSWKQTDEQFSAKNGEKSKHVFILGKLENKNWSRKIGGNPLFLNFEEMRLENCMIFWNNL